MVKRELSGVGLLLSAVFLLGLLMTYAIGTDGGLLEVRGAFGALGAAIVAPLVTVLGWSGVVFLPVLPAVHGMRLLGRLNRSEDRSWLWFLTGLMLLVPIAFALGLRVGRETSLVAGVWGGLFGFYLIKLIGYVGAWMAVLAGISALTIGTLAWNPVLALFDRAPKMAAALTPSRDAALAALQMAPPPEEMPAIDEFAAASMAKDARPVSDRRKRAVVQVEELDDADVDEARVAVALPVTASRAKPAAPSREERVTAAIEATAVPDDEVSALLPPTSLLTEPPPRNADANRRELDASGVRLMAALKTFRVEGQLVGRTTGPTVTQFEVEPAAGVKVRQFASLSNDLALAMRANSIRIVAPIPGKGAVGIEVPNPSPEMVAFREIVEHPEYNSARAALPVALGKDLEGRPVIADLAKMPHLLIAGATGSGKSVCVNTIITSLIYRHTPATLRFLMVDPKMVELSVYNTLPHLRHKVITDNRDAAAVLKWAVLEMQDRYALLAANGCRNVQDFNRRVQEGARLQKPRNPEVAFEVNTYDGGILPYIVVIIDEMADLMMTVQGEVETPIAMLAQKARAIGIHLILATQRPSVNVITGLIKANFPSRIAFRVASQIDSRTILDGSGAESLLGNGDMLFLPPGKSEPGRLQGAYLSSEDTERLMQWYDAQREKADAGRESQGVAVVTTVAEPDILEQIRAREAVDSAGGHDDDGDPVDRDKLFREAAE
ncbi:MAG TPA: DNA translocase FtsK, partial [Gemmatimonadaceae bacterium]|nr:DNA translocase FtsK [Gemmatimonadaceae bacterium]